MISEGKSVPKFELNNADGNLFSSGDLRGKNTSFIFIPRTLRQVVLLKQMNFPGTIGNFKKMELRL